MPKALSDLKRKKLIADYAVNHSYSETARMNGVSVNGVKKIVNVCERLCEKLCKPKTTRIQASD